MKLIKMFLLIITLLLCKTVYSLPCPNGQGLMFKGDSTSAIINQCGEPERKETVRISSATVQELVYYKPHPYDTGSTQMVVITNNDRVTNIKISERYPYTICQQSVVRISGPLITTQTGCGNNTTYYTSYTNFCGWSFGINDTISYVKSICGSPNHQATLDNKVQDEVKFYYKGPPPQTLIFYNDKLTSWQD